MSISHVTMSRYLVALMLLASGCQAQLWNGVLASARATAWQSNNIGVVGGIPDAAWTQCGSTIAAYGSSGSYASPATINNAIAACSANTYVLIGAGNFYLNSGIVMKSSVVLRGSGANSTFLYFNNSNACGGNYGTICFLGDTIWYGNANVQPGASNAATWTAGYSQGATSITVTNVGSAAIANNQFIILNQQDDASIGASGIVEGTTESVPFSLEDGAPGRTISGNNYSQTQIVQVTAGCSSPCTGSGPFTLTITPGLYAGNWASGNSPGMWFGALSNQITFSGVENLSIDNTAAGTNAYTAFNFTNAYNCWVTGNRIVNTDRNHVWLYAAAHITIANNYMFGTQNAASQSYGVESFISSDNLIVNNIFQQITAPIVFGSGVGNAFLYNYGINDLYSVADYMQPCIVEHSASVMYNLFEGNICAGVYADNFHGTGNANTYFRNRFTGWEAGKTNGTIPLWINALHRFENIIGNVYGQNSYHNTYHYLASGSGDACSYTATTELVSGCGDTEGAVTVVPESYTPTSGMLWGNYDIVNAANRFVSGEVPSGLSDGYANSVPATHTLPASFFYSSQPTWWQGEPWPPIGPDVTGGNIGNCSGTYAGSEATKSSQCTGGSLGSAGINNEANSNPAMDCYLNTMSGPPDGTGSVLAFTCAYPNVLQGSPVPGIIMLADQTWDLSQWLGAL